MEQIVYMCTGECKGVSWKQVHCGAPDCRLFGKQMEMRIQCDNCAKMSKEDLLPHACEKCRIAT